MERIIIFGDSIMRGVLLEDGKYICPSEERRVREESTGLEIENCCKFGATIEKGQSIIRRRIAKGNMPARCLLEYGGNDSDFDWAAVAAAPYGEHCCKTMPELFMQKYSEIIAELRAAGCEPVLSTLPPLCAERYLNWFCRDGVDKDSVLIWLGEADAIYRWQEYYSHLVEHIAEKNGCDVMHMRDAFLKQPLKPGDRMCLDGIHPNRKGQDVIYAVIREKFGA